MKVKIGKYINWIGPYQIAKKLLFWMDEYDDRVHNLGKWLSENNKKEYTYFHKFCSWIYNKRKRKEVVKIDNWDTWSADHTLSLIIHPLLVKLKKDKHGAPYTEDSDVPQSIRSTAASPKENEWDTDEFHFQRWEYILDEMIWAFDPKWEEKWGMSNDKAYADDSWKTNEERQRKGHLLFGKYFRNLWT